jgi:hypothetical protein
MTLGGGSGNTTEMLQTVPVVHLQSGLITRVLTGMNDTSIFRTFHLTRTGSAVPTTTGSISFESSAITVFFVMRSKQNTTMTKMKSQNQSKYCLQKKQRRINHHRKMKRVPETCIIVGFI